MDTNYAIEYGPRSDTRDTMTPQLGAARSGEEIVPPPAPGSAKEPRTDANVEAVRARLLQRAKLGLNKYGVTTERRDMRRVDWLRHAQEEALDLVVYLEAEIQLELETADSPRTKMSDERHYPEQWTAADGRKRLTCKCGAEWPCRSFAPAHGSARLPSREEMLSAIAALVEPRVGGDKKAQLARARQAAREILARSSAPNDPSSATDSARGGADCRGA